MCTSLYSTGPDSYLTHFDQSHGIWKTGAMCTCITFWVDQTIILHQFDWSRGIWRTGDMCTCITFCWTRQLLSITLIGTLTFGG